MMQLLTWPAGPSVRQWLSQGVLYTPPTIQARFNTLSRDAESLCPLLEIQCLILKCQASILACVVYLFLWCSPATITRFVSTRVVDSLDTVTRRWPFPNFFKKGGKILLPFSAYLYTSRAIVLIFLVLGPITARLHTAPHFIFRRISESVCAALVSYRFRLKTTTTPRSTARFQFLDNFLPSAIASTEPPHDARVVTGSPDSSDDEESSVSMPGSIDEGHEAIIHGNCDVGSDIPNGGAAMIRGCGMKWQMAGSDPARARMDWKSARADAVPITALRVSIHAASAKDSLA